MTNEYRESQTINVTVEKTTDVVKPSKSDEPPGPAIDSIWVLKWEIESLPPGETVKKTGFFSEEGTYWVSARLNGEKDGAWTIGGTKSGMDVFVTLQNNGRISVSSPEK